MVALLCRRRAALLRDVFMRIGYGVT